MSPHSPHRQASRAPAPNSAARWYRRARLLPVGTQHLLMSSGSLMASTVLTGGAGFLYWTLIARSYPAAPVGRAASIIAACLAVSLLASQAVSTTLLGRLPTYADKRSMLASALVAVGTMAALGGLATAVLLPVLSGTFEVLHSPVMLVLVPLLCAGQAAGAVLDASSIASRKPLVLVVRNSSHAVGKLLLLALAALVLARTGAVYAVVGSWALMSCAAALAAGTYMLGTRATGQVYEHWRTPGRLVEGWRHLQKGNLAQNAASIGGSLPTQLLPVLVAARAGAASAAVFSISWQLGGLCFTVSPSVCQALLAEGSRDPGALAARTKSAVKIITAVLLVPMVALLVAGSWALSIFGQRYGELGTGLLALLVLSVVPDALTNIAVARHRVRERLWDAAGVNMTIAVVVLVATWALVPALGIDGAGWAWVAGQVAGSGVVAGMYLHNRSAQARAVPQRQDGPSSGLTPSLAHGAVAPTSPPRP